MNDELQKQLATILGQIASGVKAAGDFTLSQLPDIAQQYIMFGRAFATAELLITLLMIGVGLFVSLKFCFLRKDKFIERGYSEGEVKPSVLACGLIGTTGTFFGFGLFVISLKPFILVWVAPKVWLITEIARLVK